MSEDFIKWLNSNKVGDLKNKIMARPNKSVVDFLRAHLSEIQNPNSDDDIEIIFERARLLEEELIEDAFYDGYQDAVTPSKK
jgi:hypothetical protein